MGSIGFWELVFLVLIALLVFGPERLPGVANSVGKAIGMLRREASGTLEELKRAAELDEFRGVAQELRGTRDELRGTRDELRRGLRGSGAAAGGGSTGGGSTGGGSAGGGSAGGGGAGATGAGAQAGAAGRQVMAGPPPFDPDAT